MQKCDQIYQGKAKTLYATENPNYLIVRFRDEATAFNGVKKAVFANKGKINNYFNAFIMDKLAVAGIPTHFEKLMGENESLVKHLQMIPVECVIRNLTAGNLSKRLGIEEGKKLEPALFEFFLKSDALNDPMINESHILTFGWASADEITKMKQLTWRVNDVLKQLFAKVGLILVDFKLEFGRFNEEIVLGDEFTLDGCRIWDANTFEKFDKDRFRRDLGGVMEAYIEVAKRLKIAIPGLI